MTAPLPPASNRISSISTRVVSHDQGYGGQQHGQITCGWSWSELGFVDHAMNSIGGVNHRSYEVGRNAHTGRRYAWQLHEKSFDSKHSAVRLAKQHQSNANSDIQLAIYSRSHYSDWHNYISYADIVLRSERSYRRPTLQQKQQYQIALQQLEECNAACSAALHASNAADWHFTELQHQPVDEDHTCVVTPVESSDENSPAISARASYEDEWPPASSVVQPSAATGTLLMAYPAVSVLPASSSSLSLADSGLPILEQMQTTNFQQVAEQHRNKSWVMSANRAATAMDLSPAQLSKAITASMNEQRSWPKEQERDMIDMSGDSAHRTATTSASSTTSTNRLHAYLMPHSSIPNLDFRSYVADQTSGVHKAVAPLSNNADLESPNHILHPTQFIPPTAEQLGIEAYSIAHAKAGSRSRTTCVPLADDIQKTVAAHTKHNPLLSQPQGISELLQLHRGTGRPLATMIAEQVAKNTSHQHQHQHEQANMQTATHSPDISARGSKRHRCE